MIKRILKVGLVVVFATALTTGVVLASTTRNITATLQGAVGDVFTLDGILKVRQLIVGSQVERGIAYLNGIILNNTKNSKGKDNPVTIADDLRVDGRIYRGVKAGPGDKMPLIINDDLKVTGNIRYDNSKSGLKATSVQGAIDELGAELTDLINGANIQAGSVRKTGLSPTTWTGTIYDLCGGVYHETSITATFTPETATTGTWESNDYNVFNPARKCGFLDSLGTWSGSYKVAGNFVIAENVIKPGGEPGDSCQALMYVKGETIQFMDGNALPTVSTILRRQD